MKTLVSRKNKKDKVRVNEKKGARRKEKKVKIALKYI
jgi:hypothetical protein